MAVDEERASALRERLVPLAHRRPSGRPRLSPATAAAALVVILAIVALTAEHASTAVSAWAVNHPITVAIATGVALAAMTILGVQRFLARKEAQRWHRPALEAVNAYLFTADRAIRGIWEVLEERAQAAASAGRASSDLDKLLVALAETEPDVLRDCADDVRDRASTLASTVMAVSAVVAHDPALMGIVTLLGEGQRRFDDIADICRHLAWVNPLLTGEHRETARVHAEETAAKVPNLLREINEDLVHLRLLVMQSRQTAS